MNHGAIPALADLQTNLRHHGGRLRRPHAKACCFKGVVPLRGTGDFPREYKYTLGQKIKDELIELVVMIYRANSAADKARHIESIVERVQAILVTVPQV